METRTYPYRQKLSVILLSIGFFVLCSIVLVYQALYNERGLLLERVIRLSPESARVVYWVLAGVSVMFVLIGLWSLTTRFGRPKSVILAPDRLIAPKNGFARQPVEVPYSGIAHVSVTRVSRQSMLTIRHAGGKVSIPQSMLPSRAAFEDLAHRLAQRVSG